ncbi:hypothetical protein DIPPA_55517 [Diplonema papillatum]|nr:hypothetical protein DIPPA_55517 [Diplonema papillatum]
MSYDFIDLDLNYDTLPSPAYPTQARLHPPVKAEPKNGIVSTGFPIALPDPTPLAPPPKVVKRVDLPPPEAPMPPSPRTMFSFYVPTELRKGPSWLVAIPPITEGSAKGAKHKDAFKQNLQSIPETVLSHHRRPFSRPTFDDILARLRDIANEKTGKPVSITVTKDKHGNLPTYVSSSCCVTSFSLPSFMLSMLDSSFTLQQAASDFLYLSLLRKEVKLCMYTTPPQLVLQLRKRIGCLTNSRDSQAAMAVLMRLDAVWRKWRQHSAVRQRGGCHDHIEAMVDKQEESILNNMSQGSNTMLLKNRFVCGAGDIPGVEGVPPPGGGDGRLHIWEAAMFTLKSPHAYPAFVIKAPLQSLSMDRRYPISFIPLSSEIHITPDQGKTVFLRNWAGTILGIPLHFTHPQILNDSERKAALEKDKEAKDSDKSAKKDRKEKDSTATVAVAVDEERSLRVVWDSEMVVEQGGRRFYPSVQTNGFSIKVGTDVLVSAALPKTAKEAVAKSVLGRVLSLSDTGKETPKRALIRLWGRNSHKHLGLSSKLPIKDHEVVATNALEQVPCENLHRIEVRYACLNDPFSESSGSKNNVALPAIPSNLHEQRSRLVPGTTVQLMPPHTMYPKSSVELTFTLLQASSRWSQVKKEDGRLSVCLTCSRLWTGAKLIPIVSCNTNEDESDEDKVVHHNKVVDTDVVIEKEVTPSRRRLPLRRTPTPSVKQEPTKVEASHSNSVAGVFDVAALIASVSAAPLEQNHKASSEPGVNSQSQNQLPQQRAGAESPTLPARKKLRLVRGAQTPPPTKAT